MANLGPLRVSSLSAPTSGAFFKDFRTMAKICQISGKRGNNAKHIRNRHSQGWKYKAPKRNRVQNPNLQTVRIKTPTGTHRLVVATNVIKSEEFNMVACGLKPIPKAWLKKPGYDL